MNGSDSKGVIFDMDGVLVDSAQPHFRSWQLLAEENGATVTEEQFKSTFGQQNDDIIPLIFGEVSPQRLRRLADRKEELYRGLIRAQAPIVDGAPDLVRSLHDAGVALAVGSSGPLANIELVLDAMGVADLMSAIVSGDEVTRGKPHPQVFSLACTKLRIEPSYCVVIEDAPAGVRAARAAGAHVVAVLMYHPAEAFDGADCVVNRLADLSAERLLALIDLRRPDIGDVD